ncbi:MAG: DUF3311 domain-containing protein [Gemmatimonadetes bacterium]|nr:DUF3311 domain-containing protein [Gemmatimonadota bacterium]
MSIRAARRLAVAFFTAYVLVLTYPATLPFNRIRPLVLGLPFSLFWSALWVALAGIVFWILHRAESSAQRES